MSNVQYFTNDKFRVLACLYDARGLDGGTRITQQEVSDQLNLSRVTINGIFKQLKEDGYLLRDPDRASKHLLTEKAILVVEMFRVVDK
jgi:DNA-binding MarR family transcriptional regulator